MLFQSLVLKKFLNVIAFSDKEIRSSRWCFKKKLLFQKKAPVSESPLNKVIDQQRVTFLKEDLSMCVSREFFTVFAVKCPYIV